MLLLAIQIILRLSYSRVLICEVTSAVANQARQLLIILGWSGCQQILSNLHTLFLRGRLLHLVVQLPFLRR